MTRHWATHMDEARLRGSAESEEGYWRRVAEESPNPNLHAVGRELSAPTAWSDRLTRARAGAVTASGSTATAWWSPGRRSTSTSASGPSWGLSEDPPAA